MLQNRRVREDHGLEDCPNHDLSGIVVALDEAFALSNIVRLEGLFVVVGVLMLSILDTMKWA